jgi:hypothetical protein
MRATGMTTTASGACLPVRRDLQRQRASGPSGAAAIVPFPARVAQTAEQRTRNA